MKKQYQKMIAAVCLCLIFTKSKAQEIASFKISPELSKQVVVKHNLDDVKIYNIVSKDVDHYPYVEGQVPTNEYQILSEHLKKYTPSIDEYNAGMEHAKNIRNDVQSILSNIDEFLVSNDKYDVKEQFLIDAQALADKNKIIIEILDHRILSRRNEYGEPIDKIVIRLYEKGKRSSKDVVRNFRTSISNIRITEPVIGQQFYEQYQQLSDELTKTPKTQTGWVLSDKLVKKSVYVIEEMPIDLNTLSGEFKMLSEEYSLITEEVSGKFAKNELITKSNEHYNKNIEFNGHSVIKKANTNALYYVTSDDFIFQLQHIQEVSNYQNIGNTAEYKAWKTKYVTTLQSCSVNINACKAIITKHTYKNMLGEKMYDSGDFSKQEKISFNRNLDSLNAKITQLRDLEYKNEFINYYNNNATTAEATRSYSVSSYYNNTNRAY